MGKRHRTNRAHLKLIVGEALKKGGIEVPVKVALKLLKGGIAKTTKKFGLKVQDLGYKENELGELVSTIKKLTEHEIIDRMMARARHEIHAIEDALVFAEIERSIAAPV